MRWSATSASRAWTRQRCAPHTARRNSVAMRRFGELFDELDATTSLNEKLAALTRYFKSAQPLDAAWAAYFLSGRRLKRVVGPATLRQWLFAHSGIAEWLLE